MRQTVKLLVGKMYQALVRRARFRTISSQINSCLIKQRKCRNLKYRVQYELYNSIAGQNQSLNNIPIDVFESDRC